VYAHIYIDDAALGAPLYRHPECNRPSVDWYKVEEMLFSVEHKIEEIHKYYLALQWFRPYWTEERHRQGGL
jgi:hypothetical protein